MSATFKKFKQINDRCKDIVFGYIRSMECKFSDWNIPDMISYICLSFYYHGEHFAKKGNNVELSNNKMTITQIKKFIKKSKYCRNWESELLYNATYCNVWIESNLNKIAKWTF
eukprot:68723_1